MKKELITQVDENDEFIGLRPREDLYGGKLIHRSSSLLLFNSKKKLLLQKRSSNKIWYPKLYTFSVSGTVLNETYEDCIAREMLEEIGISVYFKKLFKYRYFDDVDNTFMTVFIAHSDKDVNVDKEESESFIWVSIEELENDIDNNPEKYTPPFIEGIKIYLNGAFSTPTYDL